MEAPPPTCWTLWIGCSPRGWSYSLARPTRCSEGAPWWLWLGRASGTKCWEFWEVGVACTASCRTTGSSSGRSSGKLLWNSSGESRVPFPPPTWPSWRSSVCATPPRGHAPIFGQPCACICSRLAAPPQSRCHAHFRISPW